MMLDIANCFLIYLRPFCFRTDGLTVFFYAKI